MFKVRNQEESVEICLYDFIGEETDFWTGETTGISAKSFMDALKEAGGKPIDLRIDSGGGDVFEAFAMCSAIQRYEGKVTAHIDGLAASAASYLAVVCDEVEMNDYAYIMIHCASSYAHGNAEELEDVAARLRKVDENLAGIYVKRSKMAMDQVLAYMRDETWFTADEALQVGLCTKVVETDERMAARIDPAMARLYRHVPQAISVADAKSHTQTTIAPKAAKGAAYKVLAGRIYRKDE